MTTSQSPLRVLRSQANSIARLIKQAERGEVIDPGFAAKIADAKARGVFKVGIVMDDKTVILELGWPAIAEASEVATAEMIFKYMRGSREQ